MKKPALAAVLAAMVAVYLSVGAPAFAQDDFTYDDSWEDEWETEWEDSWDDWEYDDDYYVEFDEGDMDGIMAAYTGFMAMYIGVMACMGIAGYVYGALTVSTIAKKLEEDKTWMAWVPLVNIAYLFKLAGLSPWLVLVMFIPVIGTLVALGITIYAWMKVAERRGFPQWVGLLLLVPLVGVAVPGYIAWGKSEAEKGGPVPQGEPLQQAQKPDQKVEDGSAE